jgi:hypothetical protein
MGQPVRYGEKSFIRLAIGSVNIRSFIQHGLDLNFERRILDTIESGLKNMQNATY